MREVTPPRPEMQFKPHVHGGKDGPPCPHCTTPLKWDQLSGKCPDGSAHCLAVHFGYVCPNEELEIGNRVATHREPDVLGTVSHIEENRLSVLVVWDDGEGVPDFQWSNKVFRVTSPPVKEEEVRDEDRG